jgi:ABC-type Na+ efflux pump permease subunit
MKQFKPVKLDGWWYVLWGAMCCLEVTALVGVGLFLMDKFPRVFENSQGLSWINSVVLLVLFLIALLAVGIGVIWSGEFVQRIRERCQKQTSKQV